MTTWKIALLATGLGLAASAALAAGPPAALRPAHVAGPGVYVLDIEAQKTWYMDKLGMSLDRTIARDGKVNEYIMGLGDGRAIVALARSATRPSGPNAFTRIILEVPDEKALLAWLKTQGVEGREVVPGVAAFVTDPEGNTVELYTPPKP